MVVVVHVRSLSLVDYSSLPVEQRTALTALGYFISRIGLESVLVFFVLSGFLVGGKLIERTVSGRLEVASYVADRASRIMLPLVPAILLTVGVGWAVGQPVSLASALGSSLSLQGVLVEVPGANGPLWSLSYEVWFYILAGSLAWLAIGRRTSWPALALIGVGLLVFCYLRVDYLICWCIGALGYALRRRSKAALIAGGMLFLVGVTLCEAGSNSHAFRKLASFPAAEIGAFMLCFGAAVAIGTLATFRSAPFARLGSALADFSYSLYLTHYPVLLLLSHFTGGRATRVSGEVLAEMALRLIVCVASAYAFYWFTERHTKSVRSFLRRRIGQRAPAPAIA